MELRRRNLPNWGAALGASEKMLHPQKNLLGKVLILARRKRSSEWGLWMV